MWIINAVIIHVLLLGSIFVIYFRSPVITGLQPQQTLWGSPAKRLLLIVTDGLRAESFFRHNCNDVPNVRDMILTNGGLVGVSHTRVPTESRPGHIALIAGLYEDPSAVLHGWKNNPIDFDTLFNRSRKAYAFGAHDILHIFAHLVEVNGKFVIDSYNNDLDFSGHNKTYDLDDWVFKRVEILLKRKGLELKKDYQLVFFMHLLGLDSAGHIHKPGSPLFLENLRRTDTGISRIYNTFERIFPDKRTAYVLTSDHGMTDGGSHGSGDPFETDTPFYIWGAGVAAQAPLTGSGKTFQAGDNTTLPLYDLEQAQMTPLMSALIGVPPPMNNFGIMPRGYLKVPIEYEARAVHSNALQILEQYVKLRREHQRGFFAAYLRQYEILDEVRIANYKKTTAEIFRRGDEINKSERRLHKQQHGETNQKVKRSHRSNVAGLDKLNLKDDFITESEEMFHLFEEHKSERNNEMQINESMIYYGEEYHMTKQKMKQFDGDCNDTLEISYAMMQDALEGIDYYHNYYRNGLLLSTMATFVGWMCYLLQLLQKQKTAERTRPPIVLFLSGAGVLLVAFLIMQRVALVVAIYLTLPVAVWLLVLKHRNPKQILSSRIVASKPKSLLLLIGCAELLVFSFFERRLISVGFFVFALLSGNFRVDVFRSVHKSRYVIWLTLLLLLLIFPLLSPAVGYENMYLLVIGMAVACLRFYNSKKHFKWNTYLYCSIAAANSLFCAYQHAHQGAVKLFSQAISWGFLSYAIITPTIYRSRNVNIRVELIVLLLCTLYALLSTSYELLFVVLLVSELGLSLQLRSTVHFERNSEDQASGHVRKCFRFAFGILLYTLFSFFGSGNIASISSFDPNIARCFLGTFAPFTIMGLVILKLIIPMILVITHFFADEGFVGIHERDIFISLLIICDVMGLNFLFLVRNTGSWLQIGMSISHFVIMQVTTLALLVLTCVVKFFLRLTVCGSSESKSL